ncbi:hypothetical protein [Azospirillum oryzae]|nr:hypothetical protein [Azospirillum oryzae]
MVAIAGTARADMPVIDATTWAELIAIGKTAKEELQPLWTLTTKSTAT